MYSFIKSLPKEGFSFEEKNTGKYDFQYQIVIVL